MARKKAPVAAARVNGANGREPPRQASRAPGAPASTLNSPNDSYEAIVNEITARYPTLSDRFKQVARFFTQNPNVVALESINSIAQKAGAHPSIVVRFAQHFGYSGFKEMQGVFQTRLATAAPGFRERINALETDLQKTREAGNLGFLKSLVVRDIATLQELLDSVSEAALSQAARHLKSAATIYVAGQLRSEPIAIFLRYILTMLQRRVMLLDAAGGLGPEMARTIGERDALVVTSFRHYAKEALAIVEIAKARGAPVIAITDSELSPLAKDATVLFTIPEEEYTFSRSLAAPMCLVQCIGVALAALLQPSTRGMPRIASLTEVERERGGKRG